MARLAKQLAMLLLRHALPALLDDGTHEYLTERRGIGREYRDHKADCPAVVYRMPWSKTPTIPGQRSCGS